MRWPNVGDKICSSLVGYEMAVFHETPPFFMMWPILRCVHDLYVNVKTRDRLGVTHCRGIIYILEYCLMRRRYEEHRTYEDNTKTISNLYVQMKIKNGPSLG